MKTNHILIIIGVILLIVVIVNWDKIFGGKKFKYGGDVRFVSNDYGVMNEVYMCCKEVRPDGGCLTWWPQDYPCE